MQTQRTSKVILMNENLKNQDAANLKTMSN